MERHLSSQCIAECFFLDVGHGSGNVVLLPVGSDGLRRALVIDCGSKGHEIITLLKRYVDLIETLVVSHNDADHWGGLPSIIAEFGKKTGNIYMLQDRPESAAQLTTFISQRKEDKSLAATIYRAERGAKPLLIFQEGAICFYLLHPNFTVNIAAQAARETNATSAVVMLACNKKHIVFGGDATASQWQSIADEMGGTLRCDIWTVPHHGGSIGSPGDAKAIFTSAVKAQYSIISVATSSLGRFKLPNPDVIGWLRQASSQIICTQITQQCSNDLESIRPGLITPLPELPHRSRPTRDHTSCGNSRNVACAGTLRAEIYVDRIELPQATAHTEAVDLLANKPGCSPLCRKNCAITD